MSKINLFLSLLKCYCNNQNHCSPKKHPIHRGFPIWFLGRRRRIFSSHSWKSVKHTRARFASSSKSKSAVSFWQIGKIWLYFPVHLSGSSLVFCPRPSHFCLCFLFNLFYFFQKWTKKRCQPSGYTFLRVWIAKDRHQYQVTFLYSGTWSKGEGGDGVPL